MAEWSLTTLREKLIKIGAKVVSHGRYVAFQMAGVAIPRKLLAAIVEKNRSDGMRRKLMGDVRPLTRAAKLHLGGQGPDA